MTEFPGSQAEQAKFPGITTTDDSVLITERPYLRDILLFLFFVSCTVYIFRSSPSYNKEIGMIVCSFSSLLFLYNSISLKRVRIDLRTRMIYRTYFYPLLILLENVLRHPASQTFHKINTIYNDNGEAFVPSVTKYYVIIRTDDPFNLKIVSFTDEEDARLFSQYLNHLLL
jgi:hypothetical protein